MTDYRLLPAGDTALVVEFGEEIDRDVNACVLALAKRLTARNLQGVIEVVPTFRSLMVHYDPLVAPFASLAEEIRLLSRDVHVIDVIGRHWRLPVCYDARVAPDLHDVAAQVGLTPAQVIAAHSAPTYHVYMLGFLPGQAYLGDLPAALALPRRASPRLKIPAGSVALATTMTCVFPLETPCGWHLIGRSPIPLWNKDARPGEALLAPGDKVSFEPITLRENDELKHRIAAGRFQIAPCAPPLGAAA